MLKIHWWLRTQVSEERGKVVAMAVGVGCGMGNLESLVERDVYSNVNQSDKKPGGTKVVTELHTGTTPLEESPHAAETKCK